ncbi:hypothetical protein QHH_41 [Halomonas phage QHHSV-1]|nr:hypothetical protein QHH_41 [Halomonas phage QHHSV-1]
MIYTVHNTCEAGRPVRAFVNGREVPHAFYADTSRGIVRAYRKVGATQRERYLIAVKHELPVITHSGKVRVEAMH